jgi:hypothetical protein
LVGVRKFGGSLLDDLFHFVIGLVPGSLDAPAFPHLLFEFAVCGPEPGRAGKSESLRDQRD